MKDVCTKKQLERLKKLADQFKIPVEFIEHDCAAGQADLYREIIYINYLTIYGSPSELFSTFFHEYAHILNKRERKYATYHNIHEVKRLTNNIFNTFKKVHIRAERYTDRRAAKLMKQYMPKIKYIYGYNDKEVVKWVKSSIQSLTLKDFKSHIKSLKQKKLYK